jgi:hypothetical protein
MPRTAQQQSTATLPPEVLELAAPEKPDFEMPKRLPRRLTDDPIAYVDTVTPEQAATWLRWCNGKNRVPRNTRIRTMAEDMANGDWENNGEAIKFDKYGNLLDGQNRLFACVLAGEPFRTLQVYGAVAQETMDAGAARSVGDDLKIRGEKYTATLGGILRRVAVWRYAQDEFGEGNYIGRLQYAPSKKQQLRILYSGSTGRDTADADLLREAADVGTMAYFKVGVSAAALAFCYYLFATIDREEAILFYKKLTDEISPVTGEQVHVLRRNLHNRVQREARTPEAQYAALIILAWNAQQEGREIKNLTFRVGGSMPDKFPQPYEAMDE